MKVTIPYDTSDQLSDEEISEFVKQIHQIRQAGVISEFYTPIPSPHHPESCQKCGAVAVKDTAPFDHGLCPECFLKEETNEDCS